MPSQSTTPKSQPISRERGGVGVVTMDPAGLYMHVTPDAALAQPVTATEHHFVLAHHGIARCSAESWTLSLTDAAGDKQILSWDQIKSFPAREASTALEYAGNPEDPDKPLRIVSNAVWRGPSLRSLLGLMAAHGARYVWCSGVDWGGYAGETTDGYVKDIPLAKAMDDEVIVAHEMNGAPLTPEHGFPLRLIVPGYYGTNSVKWLSAITTSAPNRFSQPGSTTIGDPAEPCLFGRLPSIHACWRRPPGQACRSARSRYSGAPGVTRRCRPSNFPSIAAPAGLRLSWNRAPEVIPGKRFAPAGARLPPATMRSRSAPATCRAASSRKACILTRSSAWHSSSAKSGISAISFRSMSLLRVISGLPVFE
jgi:DMSO/TMAO reductase YedYZ molybdopterin-dependent catalytic subunit